MKLPCEYLPLRPGRPRQRPLRRPHRGAAVVEFAVVAPVFILMVFGMIEYGRMLMVQQLITNAAREGARVAVLDGSSPADVHDTVIDYLENSGIPTQPDIVELKVNGSTLSNASSVPITAPSGVAVSVNVSIGFDQVSWLPSPMYLGGKNLTSTTVMRRESAG